ncbi:PH (Pleckstrin Homology) domain-containing protein [Actinomycetospora succinea]|uniref:PH (Pleckstrin Homology) domain-containing protein n=1 Tax=Actinomycetospora succinea TaxID=663603 RepID=A0A4R6VQZ7_9PSEU|nr:PH domain-containing protein [Actinomycetospora succinea]TDQ64954.1 PH (Pleckstrin Homology) domain-containing protein [Actinomycetospora succinea]
MAYPDGVLRRGEHVLAHRRPHWRMLVVPALVPPVAVFLAALVAGLAGGIGEGSTRTAVRLAVVLLAVLAVVWFAVLPLVRWRFTHLVVTDRRLLVREGVLTRESIDVAGATITGVRTRSSGVDRLLGAGTLVVSTAGTEEPWEFSGLGDVERLASQVEGVADDRGGLELAAGWGAWSEESDEDPEPDEPDDLDDEEPDEAPEPPAVSRWRRRARARAARTSR